MYHDLPPQVLQASLGPIQQHLTRRRLLVSYWGTEEELALLLVEGLEAAGLLDVVLDVRLEGG